MPKTLATKWIRFFLTYHGSLEPYHTALLAVTWETQLYHSTWSLMMAKHPGTAQYYHLVHKSPKMRSIFNIKNITLQNRRPNHRKTFYKIAFVPGLAS